MSVYKKHLDFQLESLKETRKIINYHRAIGLASETKDDGSWVTEADKSVEVFFRQAVINNFPGHGFLGEETGTLNKEAKSSWVIDPIDGTAEFRLGMPEWGTVMAYLEDGQAKAGLIDCPDLDLTIYSSLDSPVIRRQGPEDKVTTIQNIFDQDPKKIRLALSPAFSASRFGSDRFQDFINICKAFPNQRILHNCYLHALLFTGAIDLVVEFNLRLWDIASAQLLVEQAGGKYVVIDRHQHQGDEIYTVVFGKSDLVDKACQVINGN